jgi:hypothetical protein
MFSNNKNISYNYNEPSNAENEHSLFEEYYLLLVITRNKGMSWQRIIDIRDGKQKQKGETWIDEYAFLGESFDADDRQIVEQNQDHMQNHVKDYETEEKYERVFAQRDRSIVLLSV